MVVDIVVAIVVALLVVTVYLCSINANLRLLKATVEFVWWGGGGVCTVIFVSNPTTVLRLRLCCRWGCDNNVAANDKVRKEGVKSSRLNF